MSKGLDSSGVLRVIMIGVLIMTLSLDASAQPTVDDDEAYCHCQSWEEAVKQIRADIQLTIKQDLTQIKNLLGQHCTQSSSLFNCIPTLIQQKVDGSDFFNRSWAEFKVGFKDSSGNFWLGNDLLHQLTTSSRYKLRFDLQSINTKWYYAEYSTFNVSSEASNYTIRVSGYSGNSYGDGFSWSDGMMFTTYDRDNDRWDYSPDKRNCAVAYGGGFWYNSCTLANVNGVRGSGAASFRWHANGKSIYLKTSRMWLTC